MTKQTYKDIVTPDLLRGAIENNDYPGFKEDYHVLHCLLRIHQPLSVFEIGTNMGKGTSIICNAVPNAIVYSLDLPTELAHISLQHPINEGKGDKVGSICKFPFTQLRGDSMQFDFNQYPCNAYFVDGEHTKMNVTQETRAILKCKPAIVIYHDSDIPDVMEGVLEGIGKKPYDLYRVEGTRIAYAVKKGK